MKKITIALLMIFSVVTYSQKKKNGTVYIDHPAIDVVEAFEKAYYAGDASTVNASLAEDVKFWNGLNANKDSKGYNKENITKNMEWWQKNMEYVSYKRTNGAYPDAIEYKDEDQKDVVWVQTWNHLKGVNKETGVAVDMPVHRLYVVNADNKIQTSINYSDSDIWREMRMSYQSRENGTIYNQHEHINTIRKMIAAFIHGDMDKYYSYFADNAWFRNIHTPVGKAGLTLEEEKESMAKFMEEFEFKAMDVQGYPDYLNYGLGDAKVVQSWWKVRLVRKSDNKKIVLPLMLINNFNDEGKITGENAYFSKELLMAK